MQFLPQSIEKLIEEFNRLPGIGSKSAERLAFYLLKKTQSDLNRFSQAIGELKSNLFYCEKCQNLSTENLCQICKNLKRNDQVICIVEEVLDLVALEKTNEYQGHYHVLHGVISPMDGIGPDELKIAELVERVKSQSVSEIIFALNPSIEGEATAAYILRQLPEKHSIKITRLARGIPIGGDLEYTDKQTLKRALEGRHHY